LHAPRPPVEAAVDLRDWVKAAMSAAMCISSTIRPPRPGHFKRDGLVICSAIRRASTGDCVASGVDGV